MAWIQSNWGYLATVLFGISELLSVTPFFKANGIFQLIFGWLATQKK